MVFGIMMVSEQDIIMDTITTMLLQIGKISCGLLLMVRHMVSTRMDIDMKVYVLSIILILL